MSAPATPRELLIDVLAGLLDGCRHVAVGASSPVPGSAALLARDRAGGRMRVNILRSEKHGFFTNGGVELFDCAAEGRIDAFFLSGGQIDGEGNVNLVGAGGAYPANQIRWAGCYGSAYLYFLVPRVILFREEHSRRTLVRKVDFISAPGASPSGIHRPGGPVALVTPMALFDFDRARGCFRLRSVHPGHTLEEVADETGFAFERPDVVPQTPLPAAETLERLRGPIRGQIAETYPRFAASAFAA